MTGSSVAGIITATATVLTATGGLFLALAVFLPALRRNKATLDEVHTIVNQQRTDMLILIANQEQYRLQLVQSLRSAGVPVPVDRSTVEPPTSGGG